MVILGKIKLEWQLRSYSKRKIMSRLATHGHVCVYMCVHVFIYAIKKLETKPSILIMIDGNVNYLGPRKYIIHILSKASQFIVAEIE